MTEKEAIKGLKPIVDNEAYTDRFQDVCKTAIEALEKQIPKLAKNIEEVHCATDEFDCVIGNCPTCGAQIGSSDADDMYCSKCGQLVTWDEE